MSVSGHVCLSEATLASSTCMTPDYLNWRQHWLEATIKYPPWRAVVWQKTNAPVMAGALRRNDICAHLSDESGEV